MNYKQIIGAAIGLAVLLPTGAFANGADGTDATSSAGYTSGDYLAANGVPGFTITDPFNADLPPGNGGDGIRTSNAGTIVYIGGGTFTAGDGGDGEDGSALSTPGNGQNGGNGGNGLDATDGSQVFLFGGSFYAGQGGSGGAAADGFSPGSDGMGGSGIKADGGAIYLVDVEDIEGDENGYDLFATNGGLIDIFTPFFDGDPAITSGSGDIFGASYNVTNGGKIEFNVMPGVPEASPALSLGLGMAMTLGMLFFARKKSAARIG